MAVVKNCHCSVFLEFKSIMLEMSKISVEEYSVVERGSPMSSFRTPGSRLTFRFTVSLKIIWFSDV